MFERCREAVHIYFWFDTLVICSHSALCVGLKIVIGSDLCILRYD